PKRSKYFLNMLGHVTLLFLGLVTLNSSSTESTGQGKRCDKESLLTIRTDCQSCAFNFGVNCPNGYTKITTGSVGARDCRYTYQVRAYSVSLPGCRHICKKDYLQPQCCPGHWGPDCMGHFGAADMCPSFFLRKHISDLRSDLGSEAQGHPLP
uniref:Stabilin-2 n=1 Tax=Castor canadensis TaxID=51338 RepID=A0A8C0W8X3_CASCN